MLRIGQFAWLSQITTEALRHYDRMGLLKPSQTDAFTGYRYYTLDQLPRLYQILALKDAGLPLDQIAYVIDENPSVENLSGILTFKQTEIESHIAQLQEQLTRVRLRLQQITMEGKMPDYEVVLKTVEAHKVASQREALSSYSQDVVGPALTRMTCNVIEYVENQHGTFSTGIVLWHDTDDPSQSKASEIDVEAAMMIDGDIDGSSAIQVYDLPQYLMASTVHHGDFSGLGGAKRAIFSWIEENDYQVVGPIREVYLQFDSENPSNHVTEVQFPVEKR